MTTAERLTSAITSIGNALTAAGWPDEKGYNSSKIYQELVYASVDVGNRLTDLRDCVNELCLKCGSYRQEHLGACDGCRWKNVRKEV